MATSPSQSQPQLLRVRDLGWCVAGQIILSDISFDLVEGGFIGLLGPNGAGKSSLLRCLYRYLPPSSGHIEYLGQDIWQMSGKRYAQDVAVVLQHTPQQFQLNVTEVVALGAVPHLSWFSQGSESEARLVAQALDKVGLTHKAKANFESLSGGEKQRAMIARAVVQKPKLLIMDEPTSHLDVKYQIQIMELAKSLGVTVLASFHDLNLAGAICDRLLVLDNGRLVANGVPEEVLTEQLLSDVFGVCTRVQSHPQHQGPHITYLYGYLQEGKSHE